MYHEDVCPFLQSTIQALHVQNGLYTTQGRPKLSQNSGFVMTTLEQNLIMVSVCQNDMYVVDVYYLMLKNEDKKTTVTISCWPKRPL